MKAIFGFSCVTLVLILVFLIGWIMNIVKFVQCDFEPSYKAECIRGVGIVFAPIGAVTGYLDLGK